MTPSVTDLTTTADRIRDLEATVAHQEATIHEMGLLLAAVVESLSSNIIDTADLHVRTTQIDGRLDILAHQHWDLVETDAVTESDVDAFLSRTLGPELPPAPRPA